MPTLSDVATTVCMDYLKRPDKLDDAVKMAKKVYLLVGGKVPFDSLRVTSAELPTISGTALYSLDSITPRVAGIISISMTFGTNQYRRLKRTHVRRLDQMRAVQATRPYAYARFGGNIEMHPPPNSASFTYRLRYWSYPTIETDPGNTVIVYPEEWVELLEWETLYRVYVSVGEMEKAGALVTPMPMPRQAAPKRTIQFEAAIIPRLWNDLLQTIDQRENIDEEFGINPVVRPYTHGD